MYRRDEHYERLAEHLTEREWSEVQILNLAHRIARSALMSHEGVLEVLEYQQEIDENIAAQKEHDRWAISSQFGSLTPEQQEIAESHHLGEDIIERTELGQQEFLQYRFRDIQ